ncbi:MAG: multiheme c-type cytochrome [Polyangiaceae bacterium]
MTKNLPRTGLLVAVALASLGAASLNGCSSDDRVEKKLSVQELMNPETCKTCHSTHYDEWSGSMHAYAATDPVFRAMNRRGQEETNGALGDFCVGCHAPLAVAVGATTDGLNLDEVPAELQGVNCFFCHNTKAVEGTHNNPLRIAFDQTMRGPIADPVKNSAHHSEYSELLDGNVQASATACGSCHDIVVPSPPGAAEVALERTFAEWQDSLFSAEPEKGGLSCASCHMPGRTGIAADSENVKTRRVHAHTFPGVDVALTDFPHTDEQRELIQRELNDTLRAEICVAQLVDGAVMEVTLENVSAGHRFPTGASQDRRVWVEVRAFSADSPVYESGVVDDQTAVSEVNDPDLWQLRDFAFDAQGQPVHMFWDIAKLESTTIPGPLTFDRSSPDYFATHVKRRYPGANSTPNQLSVMPDRVSVRVRLRPMGFDVLDDLIASGHLDSVLKQRMPTFDITSDGVNTVEWTAEASDDPLLGSKRELAGVLARCVTSVPQQK